MLSGEPAVTVETYTSLPADAACLADQSDTVFGSRLWWDTISRFALQPGSSVCFVLCRVNGRPAGLFPMRQTRSPPGLDGFSTPYSCLYAPAIADGLTEPVRLAVFRAFARFCRRWGTVRLDALDAGWAHWPVLLAGARAAGLLPRQFDHFGNWHEPVAGLHWNAYLARRPGALRETVRRRLKRSAGIAGARFTQFADPASIETGIAAFESVYARSWKEPEPFPAFNAALIRATAQVGWARIGVWSIGDQPVAAQFWVVHHGTATVLKLAHDEAFKAHSPGTVLTALILKNLLDDEQVTGLDFGRGDDPYKQGWAGERRQRIGVVLINPLRASGVLALARHTLGRLLRR